MEQRHIKVFAEYRYVKEKKEELFRLLLPELEKHLRDLGAERIVFYEGADQDHILVEEFYVQNMDDYVRIKQIRTEEKGDFWKRYPSVIRGGKEKFHMWAFRKIDRDSEHSEVRP